MLLNKLRHYCLTYFLLLFIPHFNLRIIVGLEPMTFGKVASLANDYTNVTHNKWEKKTYNFLPMGFMIWLKIIVIICNI